ncbi:hypothetical protein N9A94_05130 [Akkermansiaceae bacterium]|nr:hypothetical protein [Akkermansiaceae bacterium]MDB4544729.1 hypothetical protein [Akkermansiaceae bacterium]
MTTNKRIHRQIGNFLTSLLVVVVMMGGMVSGLRGAVQVPDYVIDISQLEKAKAKAVKEKKALAFVLTDPEST